MSWGGGTDIMSDVITSFNKHKISASLRRDLYVDLIESLQSLDWGNYCDCYDQDPALDVALGIMEARRDEAYRQKYGDRP